MMKTGQKKQEAVYGKPSIVRKRKQRLALDRAARILASELPKPRPRSVSDRLLQIFGTGVGERSEILAANSPAANPRDRKVKKSGRPKEIKPVTELESLSESDNSVSTITEQWINDISELEPHSSFTSSPKQRSEEAAGEAFSPIFMSMTPETGTPLENTHKKKKFLDLGNLENFGPLEVEEEDSLWSQSYSSLCHVSKTAKSTVTPAEVIISPVAANSQPDNHEPDPEKVKPTILDKTPPIVSKAIQENSPLGLYTLLDKQLVTLLCHLLRQECRRGKRRLRHTTCKYQKRHKPRFKRKSFATFHKQHRKPTPKIQNIYQDVKIYYDRLPAAVQAEKQNEKAAEKLSPNTNFATDRSQACSNERGKEREDSLPEEVSNDNFERASKSISHNCASYNDIPHIGSVQDTITEKTHVEKIAVGNKTPENTPIHESHPAKFRSLGYSMSKIFQTSVENISCEKNTSENPTVNESTCEKTFSPNMRTFTGDAPYNDKHMTITRHNNKQMNGHTNHRLTENIFSDSSDSSESSWNPFMEFPSNTNTKRKKSLQSTILDLSNETSFDQRDELSTKEEEAKLKDVEIYRALLSQCLPGPDPIDLISQHENIT